MLNRRRLVWFWIPLLAAVTALFLIYESRRQPPLVGKGQPAQYWIGRLNYFDLEGANVSAEEFLFAAGPGVVPELVRGLDLPDNPLADWRYALYFKLGRWQRHFGLPTKPAEYRANCAIGLGLLGPAASNATPALRRAMKHKDPYLRAKAAEALGRIGADKPHIVPELAAGLSSIDFNFRLGCIIGLCHCLPGSPEAAAALRTAIQDRDQNIRSWAAQNLWRDDSDREATFAALLKGLSDASGTVRGHAAQSLAKMGFVQERVMQALTNALTRELRRNGNRGAVWQMVASLGELGPIAAPAIPLLRDQAIQADPHTATLSVIAFGRIEPENPEWVNALTRRLDDVDSGDAFWAAWELGKRGKAAAVAVPPLRHLADSGADWRTKAMAAAAAWRLDPSSPDPIHLITNHLSQPDSGQYEIVTLLGELGPAARTSLPTLLRLRYSRGIWMHDHAIEALRSVAPEWLADPWPK